MEDKNLFKYVDNVKLDDTQKAELISGEIPQFQVVRRRGDLGSFAPMAGMAAGVALVAMVLVGILSGGFDFFSTPADTGFPPSEAQIAMQIDTTFGYRYQAFDMREYLRWYEVALQENVIVARVKALSSTKPGEIREITRHFGDGYDYITTAYAHTAFDIEITEVLNGNAPLGEMTVYAESEYILARDYLELVNKTNPEILVFDRFLQSEVNRFSEIEALSTAQKNSMYVRFINNSGYNFTGMIEGEEYILFLRLDASGDYLINSHGAIDKDSTRVLEVLDNKPEPPKPPKQNEPPDDFKPTPPPELTYNPVALPAHLESLNWVVRPGYRYVLEHDGTEYEGFYYCSSCDFFFNSGEFAVNERTGLYLEHSHGAHGGGRLLWIYDPINDMMGKNGSAYGGEPMRMYPRSEFAQHFPEAAGTIKIVHSVDMSMFNEGEQGPELTTDAYGLAAVAVGNEFITDFIYYDLSKGFWIRRGRDIADKIEVTDADGKRGVIGKDGSAVLPLEFEDILIIDKWTAFVKLDGHWGIVAFYDGDVPNFMPSGAGGAYIEGDYAGENLRVQENPGGFVIVNRNGDVFFNTEFDRLVYISGKNIRGYKNNDNDVYFINVRDDNNVVLTQVQLKREWAGNIYIYENLLNIDIPATVENAERAAEEARDYVREAGYEIYPLQGVQLLRNFFGEASANTFIYFSGTADGITVQSFLFEVVFKENGHEWEIRDITQETWG
jgi:hypothetical protein